jgi:hypothetical protein
VQFAGFRDQVLGIAAGMLETDLATVAEHVLGHNTTAQQAFVNAWPDGMHRPGPLVPRDRGMAGPFPTVDHLQVGGADAASSHPHEDLPRTGAWGGPIDHL